MSRVVVAMALVLGVAGCQKNPEADRPKEGEERGDCYGNGTCNKGLMCLSKVCVAPPPADCDAIAKKVGNTVLSNYAPHDERIEFENRVITECMNAKVSKWDGECILRAKNRGELSACPVSFGQGSCDRVANHILSVVAPQDAKLDEFLENGDMRTELIRECERKGITKAQEACVLKSRTKEDVKACGLK